MNSSPVLITWVAVNNDPFERDWKSGDPKLVNGDPVLGPTLTLLFDKASSYAGEIQDVVLLHSSLEGKPRAKGARALAELREELERRRVHVEHEAWDGDDPTDHRGIFEFLYVTLPKLRARFSGRELILHISPGTPSMQTIWVLMAETGMIERPFTVVKSYGKAHRNGRGAVVPVKLGIETFYNAYMASRPGKIGSEDQGVIWDPKRFKSDAMKRVYDDARRFAALNVPVLIRGERGTGKTTLASWIRSNSPFRKPELDGNWPSVACGQYSPELMRAELFGHKKGAFTGASKEREGLLKKADGDTLFLDEIGDVSPDLQRLLIRAIEEKQFYPLGDDTAEQSDFRLISATNVDQGELDRRLDADFLDRISLFSLTLPPLREVRAELTWLWSAVYAEAARRAGVDEMLVFIEPEDHEKVVARLAIDPLRGNLRDLFRVAYRVLAARSDTRAPLGSADAATYGLEALGSLSVSSRELPTLARSVAAAFAEGASIDELLLDDEALNTKEVFGEMKAFLAAELQRIAKARNVDVGKLSEVKLRTLQGWTANGKQAQ